jgi:hypothetical protein
VDKDYAIVAPHSGSYLAWLAGLQSEDASIEQMVTVPVGRSYLHYWQWRLASTDSCALDQASLLVNEVPVQTYALCWANDTGNWVETVVDLSAEAGQQVALKFRVTTSPTTWGSWFIDDVSFQVTEATADVGISASPDRAITSARKPAPSTPTP